VKHALKTVSLARLARKVNQQNVLHANIVTHAIQDVLDLEEEVLERMVQRGCWLELMREIIVVAQDKGVVHVVLVRPEIN
jgi:hypothetical protein